jgi:hypothetical protein
MLNDREKGDDYMKKTILSKSFISKLALIIAIVILFNFTFGQKPVQATVVDTIANSVLHPVMQIPLYAMDGILGLLQNVILGTDQQYFQHITISSATAIKAVYIIGTIAGIVLAALLSVEVAGIIATVAAGGTVTGAITAGSATLSVGISAMAAKGGAVGVLTFFAAKR